MGDRDYQTGLVSLRSRRVVMFEAFTNTPHRYPYLLSVKVDTDRRNRRDACLTITSNSSSLAGVSLAVSSIALGGRRSSRALDARPSVAPCH